MRSTPPASGEARAAAPRGWFLRHLDSLAIGISGLCVVQCLATPILLALLPVLGASALHGELFHRVLAFVIVPTSVLAFFLGCWQHRRPGVLVPAVLGLVLIVVAAALGYERLGMVWETALTVVGSIFLAVAHVLNFRLCRRRDLCPDHAAHPPS